MKTYEGSKMKNGEKGREGGRGERKMREKGGGGVKGR